MKELPLLLAFTLSFTNHMLSFLMVNKNMVLVIVKGIIFFIIVEFASLLGYDTLVCDFCCLVQGEDSIVLLG